MDGWENFPGNMKEILERFSNCKYERGIIWSNAVVSFVLKMYLPGDKDLKNTSDYERELYQFERHMYYGIVELGRKRNNKKVDYSRYLFFHYFWRKSFLMSKTLQFFQSIFTQMLLQQLLQKKAATGGSRRGKIVNTAWHISLLLQSNRSPTKEKKKTIIPPWNAFLCRFVLGNWSARAAFFVKSAFFLLRPPRVS